VSIKPIAGALAAALLTGLVLSGAGASTAAPQVEAAVHPGQTAYGRYCAACHDNGAATGAPGTDAVRNLSRANIRYSLEYGYMRETAKDVPKADIERIIEWLPRDPTDAGSWTANAACPANKRTVKISGAPRTATNFGLGLNNNRAQTAAQTGLSKAQMKDLELAWTIAFPQTATMRSQPVVIGKTIFIAATDSGHIYALDTESGCLKWSYTSDMTLRSSLAFAEPSRSSPAMIIAGDAAGRVHAVNAANGRKVWVTDIKLTDVNRITGAPNVHDGKVYVPLSAIEVNYAGPDGYGCCIGQGAVVALDLATGKNLWIGRTMEPAKPTQKGRTGTQQWGPSGAIIWSTPIVDTRRKLIYAGTGENTSWPATPTSDAIIAYDMATGATKWVFQATKADIWNYACGRRGANCDWPGEYQSPDHDFGGTSILITRKDKTDLIIAPQKSGVVWALNPDTGALVWSNKIGRGSAGGGVRWGIAFDGELIFAPQNDPATPSENPNWGPGMHALDAMTGEVVWSYKPNNRDCGATLPAAVATRPPPEWRIQRVVAPVLPPARTPAAQAAGRSGTGAAPPATAGRAPAAPQQAASEGGGRAGGAAARCRLGMSPAPIIVDGAVVTGTSQGMLRIFDNKTGAVLFEYQTNRPYPQTVNGVPGQGGGLDAAPYVAADGTLFVQSGYARFGEPPGNVLLAFRPKGAKR